MSQLETLMDWLQFLLRLWPAVYRDDPNVPTLYSPFVGGRVPAPVGSVTLQRSIHQISGRSAKTAKIKDVPVQLWGWKQEGGWLALTELLLNVADGGATRNSCILFNKTPEEVFEGRRRGAKNHDSEEISASRGGSKLTLHSGSNYKQHLCFKMLELDERNMCFLPHRASE